MNEGARKKRMQKKYTLPVIGHFADRSVEFKNILEAEQVTGINYTLIFEACIGKIDIREILKRAVDESGVVHADSGDD